jgi:chorismate dehydratase
MDDASYKIVMTGDGSYTLYMPEYDEHMHSLSGAYEESLLKHVHPSGILTLNKKKLQVLDVGFGLGYNILALIEELSKRGYEGGLTVISLEKERRLLPALESVRFHDSRDNAFSFIKEAYRKGASRREGTVITLLFGDARNTVRSLTDESCDAVFFDPFSPSRNPELWSVDFFKQIYRVMNRSAVLTTYSSAPQVRGALLEAGFTVGRGPSVGGKREGTLAAKTGIIHPLAADEVAALQNSGRAVPYRDSDLTESKSSMLERRRNEIKLKRSEQKRTGVGGTGS